MALKHLSEEEIRTWTLEQKDRWWLANVWRGDMPQLTLRAALTGMMLGGLLSLTNLYVGAKTGWTLGVGITSVILAFALFRIMSRLGLASEFTVLENNCMQSIATSAGYMTSPMISSLAAYMMVTGNAIPQWITTVWIIVLALLGVLFAFPLKRRFINDEQHPFPEGRAAGIVMDALHTSEGGAGMFKAKLLLVAGAVAAAFRFLSSEQLLHRIWSGLWAIPEYLDEWVYRYFTPAIRGTELRELNIRLEPDLVMFAAGGLMGIRTGVSLMIGAVLNYVILAPWAIARGDVRFLEDAEGVRHYGFKLITEWALWGGVAMMTLASLVAFFAKPQVLLSAFRFGRKKTDQANVLADIELPMSVFAVGIPVVGTVVVFMANWFFDVALWHGAVAIPLIFIFTLIAVNSTALTSITPLGALGKLTQLTYGAIAPGNPTTNLITAGITAEAASNASNLLMDIKPGYMLGAKPRQQAIGHVLGIFAGSLASVPVFYYLFMRGGPENLVTPQFPMPSATVWKAVADMLTKGLSQIKLTSQYIALAGALIGVVLEVARIATKGRFWLSGVGIGLAFVIPFPTCLAMFLGALTFWIAEKIWTSPESAMNRVFVQNQEPICGGLIAGGALMGIVVLLLETLL